MEKFKEVKKKEGVSKRGYSKKYTTYFGIEFKRGNLRLFHNLFMEKQAESWDFDLQREILRQQNELTTSEERRIDKEFQPLKKDVMTLYNVMRGLRKMVMDEYDMDRGYRAAIDSRCAGDFSYWINYFGWTEDPRLSIFGLPSKLPFILTDAQEKALHVIDKCLASRSNVLIEKSRAEGITELLCMYDVWKWKYNQGYVGGWGSRVERLVDKKGDPGTIFSRLRRIIFALPLLMRPTGYADQKKCKFTSLLTIINPDNDAVLLGEGGDNIGRGNRYTTAKVDEKAFVEHPQTIDDSLSQTTNCQIDISTPNGQDEFYQKRISGKVQVITLWWYKNPSKNPKWRTGKRPPDGECSWYELQKLVRDSVVVAKEIDIDYAASIRGSMIPSQWVRAAIDFEITSEGPRVGGLDLAAGGKDNSVYISRSGPTCGMPQILPFTSPSKSAWASVDIGKEEGIELLVYDKNSLGEDIHTILKEGDRKAEVELLGVYGQGRASDRLYDADGIKGFEKYRNARAECWDLLRKRFEKTFLHRNGDAYYPEEEMISIPGGSSQLANQLSSPRRMYLPNGKIGVESKREMASRNVPSPDEADALSYAFYPTNLDNSVLPSFKASNSENYKYFELKKTDVIDIYVSLYHTTENKVYVNVCGLNLNTDKLLVLTERVYHIFNPSEILRNVMIDKRSYPIRKWYGNPEIMENLDKGVDALSYKYRKAKIPLKTNLMYDHMSSIETLDRMFRDQCLIVHESCDKTMNHVRNWKMEKGKPQTFFYFALCLSQIICGLKKRKIIFETNSNIRSGYKPVQ